jgi:dTDP-4-amino-4,6-dideoxygalactose transaminase
MQSAIGRVQLRKLPHWTHSRKRHAAILTECFATIPALRVTPPSPGIGHAYYKYYTFVRPDMLKPDWSRDRIMNSIAAEGIPCYSGSCSEIYHEKAFIAAGLAPPRRLPVARDLGETSLMFLVHPTLCEADMADTCHAVDKVMAVAARL